MAGQPVNKWIQSIFWPISVLPSFGHIPKHSADDYVGRTSPLLGTCFAFWIVAIGTIVLYLIQTGVLSQWSFERIETVFMVAAGFTALLYVVGFFQFFTREEQYPN